MVVLKLLGFALVLAAALMLVRQLVRLVRRFDTRAVDKFGYALLSKSQLWVVEAACGLLWGGSAWRQSALRSGDATLNGTVLMALGACAVVALALRNFRRTDWRYGTAGTVLQVGLLPFVFQFGITVFLSWAAWVLVVAMTTRPVWVVNR